MMARSHFPFALSIWWLTALTFNYQITAINSLIAGVGGLLPDIDHPGSTVGRKVPFISVPLSKIFKHRGFTHSLLAAFLVAGGIYFITQDPAYAEYQVYILPLFVGYLSHLLGDGLTITGVPLFWPHPARFRLRLFSTNSWAETMLVTAITAIVFSMTGMGQEILADSKEHFPQFFNEFAALETL